MEKLYSREVTPGGKVKYHETNQIFSGNPAEGIWYVKKENYGQTFRWINEKLEDLPKARKIASLEPYRDELCKLILDKSKDPHSVNDLVSLVFDFLSEKMEE